MLARACEVLAAVDRAVLAGWPEEAAWARLLPEWFMRRSGPAMTAAEYEDVQRRMRRRRRWMPWVKQENMNERDWSLANWVYWFQPENRNWYWWGGKAVNPDLALVEIEIDGWPLPWAALGWVLRASGATSAYGD